MVLSFLYAVILPIIMQRLEKYHFMQVGFSVFVFPPLTLSVYVCYQGFFFVFFVFQRITYLHGPIQVMLVGGL